MNVIENILDRRLSVENILEISMKFQIVRFLILDEDQKKKLDNPPAFRLEDHLNENYDIWYMMKKNKDNEFDNFKSFFLVMI